MASKRWVDVTAVYGTLGFTPGKLLPTVRQREDVEALVFFHDEDDRSREAAATVEAYCEDVGVPATAHELDAFEILACARAIRQRLADHDPHEVVFNITGGTPILSSAALLSCVLDGVRAVTVDERTGDEVQLPLLAVRYGELLNDAQRRVLSHVLGNPGTTAGEVAEALDLSKATVSHHVSNLRDRGLVEAQPGDDGRTRRLEVIEAGELLLLGEDVEVLG